MLMYAVALTAEVMAVGSLLHRQIVPVVRLVIRPDVHIRQQVILVLWQPLEHPIDHGHNLSTGDPVVGPEGSVGVTTNPAQSCSPLNFVLGPVAGDFCEAAVGFDAGAVKSGADGRELSAGDRGVRVEYLCRASIHNAQPGQGGNGRVAPHALIDILKGVGSGQILIPDLRVEQSENDRGDLGAADMIQWTDGAVRVADDIGEVVLAIEPTRDASWIAILDARLENNLSQQADYLLASEAANAGKVILSHADAPRLSEPVHRIFQQYWYNNVLRHPASRGRNQFHH